MCCVCSLLCKIVSFAISVLSLVLLVLLILWLVGVLFQSDSPATSTNEYLKSAGEYKYSALRSAFST